MKKFLAVALASLALAIPVSASVEDVKKYLEPHVEETGKLEVMEYCDPEDETEKSVLIMYTFKDYNSNIGSEMDNIYKRNPLLLEMINQEWFDYQSIQFLKGTDNNGYGILEYDRYNIGDGAYANYTVNEIHPWFIRDETEIEDDKREFLCTVANENLTAHGIFSGSLNNKNMKIQLCYNLAIVSGTIESEGKTYDFTTEFKFRFRGRYDGTYETLYLNVNDVTLVGELEPIEDYVWKIY